MCLISSVFSLWLIMSKKLWDKDQMNNSREKGDVFCQYDFICSFPKVYSMLTGLSFIFLMANLMLVKGAKPIARENAVCLSLPSSCSVSVSGHLGENRKGRMLSG